jgi:hypothetical protein
MCWVSTLGVRFSGGQGLLRQGLFCMKILLWCRIAILTYAALAGISALAQRGGRYATYAQSPPQHTTGFPGFFDTEVAPAGGFSFDVPSMAVDYGLSERLTIGVNAWSLVALQTGFLGAIFKARYLLFGSESTTFALTTYGGGFLTGGDQYSYLGAFSLNVTTILGERQSLGASLFLTRLGVRAGTFGEVDYAHLSLTNAFIAGRYRYDFGQMFSLEGLIGSSVVSALDIDSAGVALQAQVFGSSSPLLLGRVSFDLRLGQLFLLSPQLYLFGIDSDATPVLPIPMINLAFKTR